MRGRAPNKIIIIGLALLVSLIFLPMRSLAAPEPDHDIDAYDQVTCLGVSEDDVEDVDPSAVQNPDGMIDLPGSSSRNYGNDPDEFSVFPNNSFDLPFDASGGGQNFSFTPTYTQDERSRVNDSYYPEPDVTFEQAQNNAQPGQDVTVSINTGTFQAEELPGQGFYYASFVDGIFLNGYNAGADWSEIEQLRLSVDDPTRPECGTYYRPPKIDKDKDGIDDNWELRYGLNPADPTDAAKDFDHDGYLADLYPNALGELVNPAPLVKGAELGDGVLTNYEEYVFGTNPLIADTDGDGFTDEQDLVGLGQQTIKFRASKGYDEGPYRLHSIVVGSVQKRDEQENKLIKIDSATKQIYSRRPEDLQVNLQVLTAAARAGQVLKVRALPARTKARALTLSYDWSVNQKLQTDQSGLSHQTLNYVIPAGSQPGDTFLVQVKITNPATGQISNGQKSITLGDALMLDYDPLTIDPGSVATINALLVGDQNPQNYLFLWSLDGQSLNSSSKVGANKLIFAVTKPGGESYDLALQVLDRQSQPVAKSVQKIKVQKPTVSLILIPTRPRQNSLVVVRAHPEHFSDSSLIYNFTVDGKTKKSHGSQISFEAGAEGSTHQVKVSVIGSESTGQATADIEFTTGPGTKTVLNSIQSGPRGLAAMIAATPWAQISLEVFLGLILTVGGLFVLIGNKNKLNLPPKT